MYISVRKTLLQIFGVRVTLNNEPSSTPGILGDFCDGVLYKEHPILSHSNKKNQHHNYYDEIEVCNPLGSHAKTHKLGCLFSVSVIFMQNFVHN